MCYGERRGMMTFVFATTLLIASTLGEQSTTSQNDGTELADAETKKRPQNNFVNGRSDLDKYQQEARDEEPMRLLREPDLYLERLLGGGELNKRASMRGFQGMRGKKSDYELDYPNSLDYYEKRAPMGFQGVRGKKTALETYLEDELEKRAPMGFQGMRGKKSLEELLDELEKRAMMGFQGVRGKKAEEEEQQLDDPEERRLQSSSLALSTEWQKRAPMGFQGMRGRKSMLEELDELEKRAPMGFQGVRGKKDMYGREFSPLDADNYIEKRPMMMGFHGMRGKRSANYYDAEGMDSSSNSIRYEKRSPYRFYGSRGKKNPRWELRTKGFVGVRGKKWSAAPRQFLIPASLYDELELSNVEDLTLPERH